MDFNYKTLFRISFRHNYFGSGVLSRISVKLSPETANTLKNYGLAYKQVNEQLAVLFDAEDAHSEHKLQALVTDKVKLQFWVYVEEPTLLNFTDLPYEQTQDSVYYFSNALATNKLEGGELALSQQPYVSAKDKVQLFQGVAKFGNKQGEMANNAAIFNIFKEKRDAEVQINGPNTEVLLVNGESGYCVFSDGKTETPFYTDNDFGWQVPFAVVDLLFDNRIKEAARPIGDKGNVQPLNYVLSCNRRAVFRKYYIMSSHLRELDGLAIANGKTGPEFIGPQKERVLGKHESESFVSNIPLDFTENRKYKFQLHKNFDRNKGGGKTVMKSLPNPNPAQLKPMIDKPGQYYTEIFIY